MRKPIYSVRAIAGDIEMAVGIKCKAVGESRPRTLSAGARLLPSSLFQYLQLRPICPYRPRRDDPKARLFGIIPRGFQSRVIGILRIESLITGGCWRISKSTSCTSRGLRRRLRVPFRFMLTVTRVDGHRMNLRFAINYSNFTF